MATDLDMLVNEQTLRDLPAPDAARTSCSGCGQPIVWAMTVAGQNGRGGKLMPLDPSEHPRGNVAVTIPHGRLLARVLAHDEQIDHPLEYAGIPHFATCRVGAKPELPANVVDLGQQRSRRRGRSHR